MGFLDSLFGGGGTDIQQVPTLTGGQTGLLQALTSLLTGQVGQGITPYQGTRPGEVPFGPLLQQGFGKSLVVSVEPSQQTLTQYVRSHQ